MTYTKVRNLTMFQPHKMSDFLILKKLVSTRNDVLRTSPVIPYWWCISITTQTWVVIRHHYGISALVSQKKKNKQTNEQTKTRKKKQLNWKKKKNGKQVVTSRRFLLRLIGTLRSNDADGDENVKKTIGFINKTTALHVHHTFFVHFFPVFAQLRRENA